MMYIPKDEANGRPYDGYIDIVERDGYNHLGYFSPLNASTPQYITGGNWEVMCGIAAFDKDTNLVYFPSFTLFTEDTSSAPRNPLLSDISTAYISPARIPALLPI